MTTATGTSRPSLGALYGTSVATAFGLVFLLVNGAMLPRPGFVIVCVLAALALAAVVASVVRRFRGGAGVGVEAGTPPQARGFRLFWLALAGEIVALIVGLAVLRHVGLGDYGVAWVALVVGVHFFPLARQWNYGTYTVIAVVMSVLGLAGLGFMLAGVAPWVVAAVSGVGSGLTLLAAAAYGPDRARRAVTAGPAAAPAPIS